MADVNLRGYLFKYGFIWLAWVLRRSEPVCFYYDNEPMKIEPEMNIKYLTISFSKKRATERMRKWMLKEVNADGKRKKV